MTMRWQLPVYSPVGMGTLVSGAAAALAPGHATGAARRLRALLGGRTVALTDSGTSALVLALRALVPPGGAVALPAWGCIDLTAAVAFTGARVRLYDLTPDTMSPDLDSVEQALTRGVDAIVVAHFYGYPADVPGVHALARCHGATVIEDAAQRAGATLHGAPLGGFGDATVLSFGRGKGTTGGAGGALVAHGERVARHVDAAGVGLAHSRGLSTLVATAAQWALGRPGMYGIPASLPMLRLGEMVHHPAHEPAAMSGAATAMVLRSLARDPHELRIRRTRAAQLRAVLAGRAVAPVEAVSGGAPGYLRFVVRAPRGAVQPAPRLGILRGYPMTLDEHPPLRPLLLAGEAAGAGARELRDTVLTLPTHSLVSDVDVARVGAWVEAMDDVDALPTRAVVHA